MTYQFITYRFTYQSMLLLLKLWHLGTEEKYSIPGSILGLLTQNLPFDKIPGGWYVC